MVAGWNSRWAAVNGTIDVGTRKKLQLMLAAVGIAGYHRSLPWI
jgi:hypothetical protein